MQINGLTQEEIVQALSRAGEKYGGNVQIVGAANWEEIEPYEETVTYRSKEYVSDGGYYNYRWTGDYIVTTYTHTINRRYLDDVPEPVMRSGKFSDQPFDKRFKLKLKPRSSRRPGSRVSQEHHYFSDIKQKRIGSSCWHVHRDFMFEVFAINPDARIITALADYKGLEDFEDKFPDTYHSGGMAGPAVISSVGGACNCDEGDYPEFAVEGLTEAQYDYRMGIWEDYPDYSQIKAPKRERALR